MIFLSSLCRPASSVPDKGHLRFAEISGYNLLTLFSRDSNMAGPHQFLSVDQLKARREKLLHDAGMSYEGLLDGQYTRS